ncbi:hypothetical protein [uncultured Enterovirga sp.]|uniref:hypothetical protein n=1 Tax=uncultured Enterovirga sp. TaxID=2026352 RepID=UPI0035CA24B2
MTPGPAPNAAFLAALDEALAADASDEATCDLLSVTFDEDEGKVIEATRTTQPALA